MTSTLRLCCVVLAAAGAVPCLARAACSQTPPEHRPPEHRTQEHRTQATERLDLALGLLQRELYEDAARHLREFLKQQPHHDRAAEAHYRLGTCYLELGDESQAIRSFTEALERGRFPLRAECRYRLGQTLKKDGKHKDLDRAARQFRQLVEEEGNGHYLAAASCYAEAEALRDLGRSQQALQRFLEAAECNQDDENGGFGLPALYQAGFLMLQGGQPKEASTTFLLAARRHPRHKARGECLYLAGEAALRGGDVPKAEDAYTQAVAVAGEHVPKAMLGLARCARQSGDSEQAIRRFRNVAQRFGNNAVGREARVEAGRLLFEDKRYEQALAELQPVLDRGELPKDLRQRALEVMGLCKLQLGQSQQAIRHLDKALALVPEADKAGQARLAYHLGEAHADQEDWEAAATCYGRAAGEHDDKPLLGDALYGQCLALHRLGRFEDSNRAIAALLARCPQHRLATAAAFARAENHFQTKDYEAARAAYLAIPKQHELGSKARYKAAWCSYLRKDYQRAAREFRALASADRQDPICEEALAMAALAFLQGEDFTAALTASDRYRARYPEGRHLARSERVAARVLKRQGHLQAAAERLAAAAAAERSRTRAGQDLLEYADVLYQQGDYEGAGNAYRKLVDRKDAAGARAHEGLAWCAFELGEDEACGEWIQKGLAHPKAGAGRANLLELECSLHHRRGDWQAAAQVATRFLQEFRNHRRALHLEYALGVAQSRNGKLEPARRTLTRLTRQPGFDGFDRAGRVHYELAWVHRKLGQEEQALASFREVARQCKDQDLRGEADLQLGEALLKNGDSGPALAHLAKVQGRYRCRARYRIGFHWFQQGQFAKALPSFEAIVQLGPGAGLYLDALFLAGECHYRAGKFKRAAERFGLLLRKAPDHERSQLARLHLGASQIQEKKPREAAQVLEEYLRRTGDEEADTSQQARAHLWLGQARQHSRNWARAEAAYQEVVRLTDTELAAEAQYRIGECRRCRGDWNGAADAFVKLPILYGHETWVQRGLLAAGDCYLRLKQPKKAKRFYQELVTRYPRAELTKNAQKKLEDINRRL